MTIAYIYPEKITFHKARTVSVKNTIKSLSKITNTVLICEQDDYKKVKTECETENIIMLPKKLFSIKSNKIFNFFLNKQLHKSSPDILYVRHLKTAHTLLKNKNRSKIVFECHEIFHYSNPKLKQLERFVYENCDGLVFINETLRKQFNQHFNLQHIPQIIADNGTSFDLPYLKKDFKSQPATLTYIGNFYPWKGVDFLLESMSELPNIHLTLIGGGNRLKELYTKAESLGITTRIDFKGPLPHHQVKNILRETTLAVIPNIKSDYVNFSSPIKLYEYLSASSIVIASDMPTIREIITDGVNGFLFETGNQDAFVKTVKKILNTDQKKLQKISFNAWKTSLDYTWKKRAKKIYDFCKELI